MSENSKRCFKKSLDLIVANATSALSGPAFELERLIPAIPARPDIADLLEPILESATTVRVVEEVHKWVAVKA